MGKNMKNIMLVGLPRSGTTLTCHLINKLPDAVALHEPLQPMQMKEHTIDMLLKAINDFCVEQRESILSNGIAISKTKGGKVPDNPLQGLDEDTGKRVRVIDSRELQVNKELKSDFSLVVKHNAFFAAILDSLVSRFECYAVVRNPLSVLLSWNSVEFAVSNGFAPCAEAFYPSLKKSLRGEKDKYTRQLTLLNWYYDQMYKNISPERILRYEETVSSGGKSLKKIIPSAQNLEESLNSKNNNPLYNMELKDKLINKLLDVDAGGYLNFYSRNELVI